MKKGVRVFALYCALACLMVCVRHLLSTSLQPNHVKRLQTFGVESSREAGRRVNKSIGDGNGDVAEFCSPFRPPPNDDHEPFEANFTQVSLEEVRRTHLQVGEGGHYRPRHCTPLSNVAIVVPFRDRQDHLGVFLNNIHSLLLKQNVQYRIFVVHQKDENEFFNHGVLNNIGFLEANKADSYDCFIFHDIDTIPDDKNIFYHCPLYPFQLSPVVDKLGEPKPVRSLFGGVVSVHHDLFLAANGYSNGYWGWGGEDDDFYFRLLNLGFSILKNSEEVGRFRMQRHLNQQRNPKRIGLLENWRQRMNVDGFKRADYTIVQKIVHPLYTEYQVRLPRPTADMIG